MELKAVQLFTSYKCVIKLVNLFVLVPNFYMLGAPRPWKWKFSYRNVSLRNSSFLKYRNLDNNWVPPLSNNYHNIAAAYNNNKTRTSSSIFWIDKYTVASWSLTPVLRVKQYYVIEYLKSSLRAVVNDSIVVLQYLPVNSEDFTSELLWQSHETHQEKSTSHISVVSKIKRYSNIHTILVLLHTTFILIHIS